MRVFPALVVALSLTTPAVSKDLRPELQAVVRTVFVTSSAFSFAEQIAGRCEGLAIKRGAERSLDKWVAEQRRVNGFSKARLDKEIQDLPQGYKNSVAQKFLKDTGIDPSNDASFCAGGARAIRAGSVIGNYLKQN